jgi:putative ABC transport system permease protein
MIARANLASSRFLLREARRNLVRRPQRTILAALGIAIGTSCLVAVLLLGQHAQTESARLFEALGTQVLVAEDVGTASPSSRFDLTEIASLAARLPAIAVMTPVALASARSTIAGKEDSLPLLGALPALRQGLALQLARGRFLQAQDARARYAILGAALARKLGSNGQVGGQLRLGGYFFEVIGILRDTRANPLVPTDINETVIVPLASMPRLTTRTAMSHLVIRLRDREDTERFKTVLQARLDMLHQVSHWHVHSARQLIEAMQAQHRLMLHLLGAVALACCLAGVVAVANVMFGSVSERRQEIGLRKVIGTSSTGILAMFTIEAALLGAMGGLLGASTGTLLAGVLVQAHDWHFAPSWPIMTAGIALATLAGALAGLPPALRASRLWPAIAMRAA